DKDRRGGFLFSQSMAKLAAKALGLPDAGGDIIHELGADRLFLDGLVSVWHP
ncbi:signal peptide peptidase SppA, partial [Mesorhizobium sp. M2A.F.Ca.ET.040.01.1.1]